MDATFEAVEQALRAQGPAEALDTLAEQCKATRNYALLFDARLLKKRHELGLDLLPHSPVTGLTDQQRIAWDDALLAAAKEAGALFLADGQIDRAFPYYRAMGDINPVREAIEAVKPGDPNTDAAIEVAFGSQVHPRKGYELILGQHGTCRAITCFEQIQDPQARADSLAILSKALYTELLGNLRRTIEQSEGAPPAGNTIVELIHGRDQLFGEYDYYVDTSHLLSVIRFAIESEDPEVHARALEFCEYGKRLGSMFQHPGEAPFEDFYRDHAIYLRALMGSEVDAAIAHFRAKVAGYDTYQTGTYPAQVLVRFLLKLKRPMEAVKVSVDYLKDADPNYLSCPTTIQLCQMAGDYETMLKVAEDQKDLISYAAALLHG